MCKRYVSHIQETDPMAETTADSGLAAGNLQQAPLPPLAASKPVRVPFMDVTLDRRGLVYGLGFAAIITLSVVIGSQGFRGFDGALAGYCFTTIFALFGIAYRYAVWLQRPATHTYWTRGWKLFWAKGCRMHNIGLFFKMGHEKMLSQKFIRQRSFSRWLSHQLIFWGCSLAIAITFPLTFGWLRFESDLMDPSRYLLVVFGFRLEFLAFPARSVFGWLVMHGLNIAAVLCMAGLAIVVARRVRDEAEIATQRFSNDVMPLILLFAVCITGMMLTISNMFMAGKFYYWITTTHAAAVMLWLLYLPFGKFFHIVQRIANLGVWFYKAAGAHSEQAICVRCEEPYTSAMHITDLKTILPQLGFDYRLQQAETPNATTEEDISVGARNWQDVCPSCRRRLMTLNQFLATGKEFI